MSGELPSRVVASLCFVGRGGGMVKTLSGFKKSHHSIPDAANPVTNAFLGKICATELGDEAEALFQSARTNLEYKRRDISVSVSSPTATLTARDFIVEILYELEPSDPSRYSVVTTLRELRDLDVARSDGFARVFGGRFSEISFGLKKGVRVEAVIDAIEALDDESGLKVFYPSDYSDCTLSVAGVDATVRCTGMALEIIFPRAASPAELVDAFGALREAFQISKPLAGMIG